MGDFPQIALHPGKHKRVKSGHPWIYANEIAMTFDAKALPPGTLVDVCNSGGELLGHGFFSPHSLVVVRMLGRGRAKMVSVDEIARRMDAAQTWRRQIFSEPFYRAIHAESDGLPGLIVDRFGDGIVCQLNSAGMEQHRSEVIDAIKRVFAPEWILLRNDSSQRRLEKLPDEVEVVSGAIPSPLEVLENGVTYLCDPAGGQKTGWFYDQRFNRAMVAGLCSNSSVLDAYCYLGGFGLLAAESGAESVTLLDRSAPSLALADAAAARNGLSSRVSNIRGEVFQVLETFGGDGKRFDVVFVDPTAFAKSKKDIQAALRGYRKLARLAAAVVAPGGFLLAASCSHNVDTQAFALETSRGVHEAGRSSRILRTTGASPDHPAHPHLPESAYLKAILMHLS